MALEITRNDNTFKVEGKINTSTSSYFKTHFIITLNSINGLIIDLNKVTEIDACGLQALKSIHEKAIMWKKPFSIIGKGSKEIYNEFIYDKVA